MATYSDSQMLESVRAAIKSIVEGTAHARTVDGRSFTFLDLDKLRALEAYYQERVNASTATAGGKRPIKCFGLRMREPGTSSSTEVTS